MYMRTSKSVCSTTDKGSIPKSNTTSREISTKSSEWGVAPQNIYLLSAENILLKNC